jgi:hypothetical protein
MLVDVCVERKLSCRDVQNSQTKHANYRPLNAPVQLHVPEEKYRQGREDPISSNGNGGYGKGQCRLDSPMTAFSFDSGIPVLPGSQR